MGVPLELFTTLGSTILGGILKIWGMKNETQRLQMGLLLQNRESEQKGFKAAREYRNSRFEITRQIIALASIFAIIVLPKLAAIFWPDIPITVGWSEFHPGFLFISDKSVIVWKSIQGGFVLTPLDTNLVSAIVGLYLGASTVGSR